MTSSFSRPMPLLKPLATCTILHYFQDCNPGSRAVALPNSACVPREIGNSFIITSTSIISSDFQTTLRSYLSNFNLIHCNLRLNVFSGFWNTPPFVVRFHCQLLSICIVMESSTPEYYRTHLIFYWSKFSSMYMQLADQFVLPRPRTSVLMMSQGLLIESPHRISEPVFSIRVVSTLQMLILAAWFPQSFNIRSYQLALPFQTGLA